MKALRRFYRRHEPFIDGVMLGALFYWFALLLAGFR